MNPDDSIVSVWRGGSTPELIGSAFFVAPQIVLTARHVVTDSQSGEIHQNLWLGLVQGTHRLRVDSGCIHYHPDLDVALIRLRDPKDNQPCSAICLEDIDYRGKSIKCCGVDSGSGNRDQTSDYTVGNVIPDLGYIFDHRVKKGFSGGAVVATGRDRVIGIVTDRGKENQEALFIPLYRIRKWLNEFLHASPPAASKRKPHVDIENLAIFIDRPKQAFEHTMTELVQARRAVKLCLSVSTALNEDSPDELAKALGLKLSSNQHSRSTAHLLELIDKYDFSVTLMKNEVWTAKSYNEFEHRCLAGIADVLCGSIPGSESSAGAKVEELARKITSALKVQPRPKVLLLKANQTEPAGMFASLFGTKSAYKKINTSFEWLKKFNQDWLERLSDPAAQPLLFLFVIQVSRKTANRVSPCFRLEAVMQDDFESWLVDVQRWLLQSRHYHEGLVFNEISRFREKFDDRLEEKNLAFPLAYKTFKAQIEKVSQGYPQFAS